MVGFPYHVDQDPWVASLSWNLHQDTLTGPATEIQTHLIYTERVQCSFARYITQVSITWMKNVQATAELVHAPIKQHVSA